MHVLPIDDGWIGDVPRGNRVVSADVAVRVPVKSHAPASNRGTAKLEQPFAIRCAVLGRHQPDRRLVESALAEQDPAWHMSESFHVRPAVPADVADIERIVNDAYSSYIPRIGREPAPMTVDYRDIVASTDHAHVLVAAGETVGVIVLIAEADHVLIENVAIAPAAQGRGWGRALLAHADQLARELDLPQTRLYTNAAMTENLSFYPRSGYTEVGRRREDGFDRVYFVRDVR